MNDPEVRDKPSARDKEQRKGFYGMGRDLASQRRAAAAGRADADRRELLREAGRHARRGRAHVRGGSGRRVGGGPWRLALFSACTAILCTQAHEAPFLLKS